MSKCIELKRDQGDLGSRRWFYSQQVDLIVWTDENKSVKAWEFYYDKVVNEHVLIWHRDSGFTHLAVDDGEQKPMLRYKQSPILISDGKFDLDRIKGLFKDLSEDLPPDVADFIRQALKRA